MAEVRKLLRGGIYLARLDPAKGAEIGKLRPVILLTHQRLLEVNPHILFICPLSSQSDPSFSPLHVRIERRDLLHVTSYALVEHCRAISTNRILSQRLAQLESAEITEIIRRLYRIIGD